MQPKMDLINSSRLPRLPSFCSLSSNIQSYYIISIFMVIIYTCAVSFWLHRTTGQPSSCIKKKSHCIVAQHQSCRNPHGNKSSTIRGFRRGGTVSYGVTHFLSQTNPMKKDERRQRPNMKQMLVNTCPAIPVFPQTERNGRGWISLPPTITTGCSQRQHFRSRRFRVTVVLDDDGGRRAQSDKLRMSNKRIAPV